MTGGESAHLDALSSVLQCLGSPTCLQTRMSRMSRASLPPPPHGRSNRRSLSASLSLLSVASLALLAALLVLLAPVDATHFAYGTMSWELTPTPAVRTNRLALCHQRRFSRERGCLRSNRRLIYVVCSSVHSFFLCFSLLLFVVVCVCVASESLHRDLRSCFPSLV